MKQEQVAVACIGGTVSRFDLEGQAGLGDKKLTWSDPTQQRLTSVVNPRKFWSAAR